MDEPHQVSVHSGEPQPTWCDRCLKQSAFTVPILTMDDDGVSVIGEESGCPDCRSGCFADDLTL